MKWTVVNIFDSLISGCNASTYTYIVIHKKLLQYNDIDTGQEFNYNFYANNVIVHIYSYIDKILNIYM